MVCGGGGGWNHIGSKMISDEHPCETSKESAHFDVLTKNVEAASSPCSCPQSRGLVQSRLHLKKSPSSLSSRQQDHRFKIPNICNTTGFLSLRKLRRLLNQSRHLR